MRTLLNIIWLVLSGFWLFLGYMLAGVILCVLIVTIPWGIASFRIGVYTLWPFGREVVDHPRSGVFSFLGNVVWVILAGWWLAIGHILSGLALCITIIG
ncbi:MAG: YccF domain-containing protein, partial [Microbacterium sp.]